MNNLNDDKNAFLITYKIGKVYNKTQNSLSDPDVFHVILTMAKLVIIHCYYQIDHSHYLIADFYIKCTVCMVTIDTE